MPLDGDLDDISLSTLLQMLLVERRRVAVLLRGPRGQGTFFLENGSVVHATFGNQEGKPAAQELLTWKQGRFKVLRSTPVPTPTLSGDPTHLFLEACRREDEARETRHAGAENQLSPSTADRLGQELLSFMVHLERGLSQLRTPKTQGKPLQELTILASLVQEAQGFLDNAPIAMDFPSLKELIEEGTLVHPMLRLLFTKENSLSLNVVENLYRDWQDAEDERRRFYLEFRQGLIALLELQLEKLSGCLPGNGPQEEWQETCSVFLGELRECVQAV